MNSSLGVIRNNYEMAQASDQVTCSTRSEIVAKIKEAFGDVVEDRSFTGRNGKAFNMKCPKEQCRFYLHVRYSALKKWHVLQDKNGYTYRHNILAENGEIPCSIGMFVYG